MHFNEAACRCQACFDPRQPADAKVRRPRPSPGPKVHDDGLLGHGDDVVRIPFGARYPSGPMNANTGDPDTPKTAAARWPWCPRVLPPTASPRRMPGAWDSERPVRSAADGPSDSPDWIANGSSGGSPPGPDDLRKVAQDTALARAPDKERAQREQSKHGGKPRGQTCNGNDLCCPHELPPDIRARKQTRAQPPQRATGT